MERRYVLKKGDYYLSDLMVSDNNEIINMVIDRDFRKLYDDYERAEDDRKLIYIETGLNLEVKLFKKEEK